MQCGACPALYDLAKDCAACASGFVDYPKCTPAETGTCTVEKDCSNHAVSVTGNTATGCTCVCRGQWTGVQCETCPARYDVAKDCAACASGFVDYPKCTPAETGTCTVEKDCSNHAVSVTGNTATGCTCMCRNQWAGTQCGSCPANINPDKDRAADCAACRPGFVDYPKCTPAETGTCTIEKDCSNHAVSVTGNTATGCTCVCRGQWTGVQCETCPARYDVAKDCAACASGFVDYPKCTPAETGTCTVEKDCSNHAVSVTGNTATGCTCMCRNQWAGTQCGSCPANINPDKDCAACKPGFVDYPKCTPAETGTCTVEKDCPVSVTGNTATGCTCVCRGQWTGVQCETCPARYDVALCCVCKHGFVDYPKCTPANRHMHGRKGLHGVCDWQHGDWLHLCVPRSVDRGAV